MQTYEIETIDNAGELIVRILSDDDAILDDNAAMEAVGDAIREEWGASAKTVGRGSSYFDQRGREAGWQWTVDLTDDERAAIAEPAGVDSRCHVCGDGQPLDASGTAPWIVCQSCRDEGYTDAPGEDVRRAVS